MLPERKIMAQRAKKIAMLSVVVLLCNNVNAQEYDSIASKYKNEHAVYTTYKRRMEIKFEDGKPVATSSVTLEKLLISDLAAGMEEYNREYVGHTSSFHLIDNMQANAYLPQGKGTYKKVPCHVMGDVRNEQDQTFYDDNWIRVVAFSGLCKGARTEVTYTEENPDGHLLSPCVFQEDIPIVKETFEVVAPKYVDLSFVLKGEHTDLIKQTKTEANGMITYTFTANDLPEYKAYSNVPSHMYYVPMVIPYITSYKRYNEDKTNEMLANADQLYKYEYKNISHINMVEDTALNRIVKEVTKKDHTDREKAAHIYQWVQKNVHYIAFENGLEGFVPREAKLVYTRKYGDCKDMASTVMYMCRKAGLKAYFAWIGTTDKPYTLAETPLPIVYNHMICAIKLNDEWVFADGTHAMLPFGENRDDIQGKEAMIAIDEKNYKIVTIPVMPANRNVTTDSTFVTIADNKLQGSTKQNYKGYMAWNEAYSLLFVQNDKREKFVKGLTAKGSNKYMQNNYDVAVSDSGSKDMDINAAFVIDDYVNQVGKQYYVNMNLNRTFSDNHIDTRGRNIAAYKKYKEQKKEVVVLDIPKGYHVAYLPKDSKAGADNLWSYSISYKADKKKITLVKEYELNTMAVTPQQFAENNKMVDALKKQYGESVVLAAN